MRSCRLPHPYRSPELKSPSAFRPTSCAAGPTSGTLKERWRPRPPRVGVATADLYPSFSLGGSLGMTATSLDTFFSDESLAASIAPFISVPLFNRNKIRDQIEIQNAVQERTLIEYENTVLDAIKEVRDAIMAYGEEQKRYRILEKGAAEARSALDIADERFRSGLVDFLDVLDAQRALLSFEETQVGSRGAITQDLIRLYKALGGGWNPQTN